MNIIDTYEEIMNIIDTYEECFNPFQLPHLFLKYPVISTPFYQDCGFNLISIHRKKSER